MISLLILTHSQSAFSCVRNSCYAQCDYLTQNCVEIAPNPVLKKKSEPAWIDQSSRAFWNKSINRFRRVTPVKKESTTHLMVVNVVAFSLR